ncbi:MAG: DUF11 domain-containing protein [Anaerolineaceae bacterium]|nr:DUF11 domain-containing protein [Anaerolineaceae bacterium]
MKKNTLVTMIIIMLLSLFALGMNQVSDPELQNVVSDGIWVKDTIEGFNNAYLIVFHSDAGTYSYVVQDGVSFGELLPEVPPRESCLGYWLIDGTTDSFLTSGTPLTRDLSVSAYYEYVDGAGDYMAGRSGILMRYSDKDKPADDHTGNNDKQLVSSEMDSNGNLKRVMASKVTADNEPPVWFFDYAGLYGSNENVSLYYVRSSLGYLKVEGNSLKISSDPVRLLVLLLDDDGVCISSENNAYSQDWANGKIKDFKKYFSDSQKFYLYNGTFGNELVTLSFDPDGGNIIPVSLTDYKGKAVQIPGYQGNRYGYEFQGWARERRASEPEFMPNDVYTFEKDETLFAVWKRIAPVRVFIDPNGGTPAEGYAFNQYPGVEIDWSKYPVENGQHELLGWAFEGDASVPEFGPGETYTVGDEDKTLYAVWDVLVDVKANGGNGDVLLRYAPDTEIDLSAINVSKGEHQLLGWAESAGGEIKYQPDAKLTAKADLTLYAVWDNEKIYVAFYNFDGSVLSCHPYAPDENPGTLPVPAVSSRGEDYEFLGWTTIEGDSEPQLTPEQTAIQAPDADTYYYQVWKHLVTVTFEAENAQTNPDKMRLAAGAGFLLSEIEIIQSAEDGRLFSYWTDGLNFYLQTGTLLVPDHDVTLKAVWKSPLYTIKFDKNGGNAAAPASEKLRYGEILEHLPEYSGTKTGYDFLGWAEGKDRNVDKDPNGTDTKHYLKIYRPGESYQMNYEKDIVLYAYWNPKTVNQKEGVKFGLRLDGVIPNEPSGFSIGEYSTQYYAGHVSDEIHNPGNVFKWGIQPTQEWVYDLDTDEGDLIDYYKDNAVVRALGYNVPSLDEVKRMSDNSFDPEKQFVIWYVLKYHGRTAKDYVVEDSPSCPEGSKIDAQGFCLNADGKRFNETGGDNRNGQKLWNVDGVIVNKKNIWVNYEPGLSGITVLNMPARYSMYIQKNRQGEPIAKNIKVGATFMKNEFKPYKPEAKDYIFLGWKVKGGDDTIYTQMADYSLTDNVTFVAQWRRPSAVNSSVSKIWSGDDGYGVRPDSITVSLWQQIGSASPSRTSVSVTLPTEDGKWSYMVSGLPQFSSETATTTGTPITYFWRENTVPDLYVETHNDTNNSTYIMNTFTPNPSLNVVKTADPESGVEAGDTVTYTVVVTNNGNVTVSDISMKDTLYEALSNKEAFTLQPAGSKEFTYTYTATQADVDAGKIDNTVTAAGKDPRNDDVTASDDAEVTTFAAAPAITVVKTADPTSDVEAGDTVTYTVVVTNTGNVTVSSIEMEDTLVTLNAAPFDLAPGDSKNDITYTYTVTQADVDAGKIDNTVTAKGKDNKGKDLKDSDDAEVTTVTAEPALTVVKTAAAEGDVVLGSTVIYTVTVTNSGNVTISNINLTDTKVNDYADHLVEGTTNPFPVSELGPNESVTIRYTYTVTEADIIAGKIENTATATGKDPKGDKVEDDDDAVVTPVAMNAALTVTKAADPKENLAVDDTVTYTVKVTNSGNVTISDIVMVDTLVTLNEDTYTLLPGDEKTFTYTYTAVQADVDAGKIDNTVTAAGKDPKNNPVSGSDKATVTTVAANPSLDVVKSAVIRDSQNNVKTAAEKGDIVSYTVTIKNNGNVTVNDIILTDTLVTLKEPAFTLTPTDAPKVVTYTYTVTQNDVDAGHIDNSVTAAGKDPKGQPVTGTDTEEVHTIDAAPALTVVKTAVVTDEATKAVKEKAEAGDTVTYTITVTNSGNVTINGITLSDDRYPEINNTPAFNLAPGESLVPAITYTYTVSQEDVDAGSFTNTVTAAGKPARGPETITAQDDATVAAVDADPKLSVLKMADKKTGLVLGETITYTVVVTNEGNVTIKNIKMSDDPMAFAFENTEAFDLEPQGTKTFTYRYTVTQDDIDNRDIDNTVTAVGTPVRGGNEISAKDDEHVETVWSPDMAVSKAVKSDAQKSGNKLGDRITYTIEVENTGNVTLKNVKVTDAKTGFNSTIEVLAPGQKRSFETTYTVNAVDFDSNAEISVIKNTVIAEGVDPENRLVHREDNETVTTEKIPLIITADTASKIYDGTALTFAGNGWVIVDGEQVKHGWSLTAGQLIEGNSIESVVISGSRTDVGSAYNKASDVKIVSGTTDVTNAYAISYVDGTLTVNYRPVTVTAENKSKTYGDLDPKLTAKATHAGDSNVLVDSGLIGEDTVTYTLSRVPGEDVGNYSITPAGEQYQGNYIVRYENGNLEIRPRPLTIMSASQSKVYDGRELTDHGITSEGLLAGDVIDEEHSVFTITGSIINVGSVPNTIVQEKSTPVIIDQSGEIVTQNYQITYASGTLTVNPQAVTVKANDKTKVYGDADPALDATVTGLIGSDEVVYTLSREPGENVGEYVITPAGEAVQGNYTVSYETGKLTITPKSVKITAGSDTWIYDGTAHSKNTYTATALAAGDHISSVSVNGSQTFVDKSENVPSDAVIVNAAGEPMNDNYTIDYVNGELEVTKRSITFKADSDSKIYDGTPLIVPTYTIIGSAAENSGLAEGDKETVTVTGSQTVVGKSDNIASDGKIYRGETDVSANYDISYLPGELEVTRNLSLKITADSAERPYNGTALTKNSYTVNGLASGDHVESVTITGSQTVAGDSKNVPSAVKVVNAAGEDVTASYGEIQYINGTLKVTPIPLTITAASDTKVFDGAPLTKNAYTKTDLAAGDRIASITVTGSQTRVGKGDNVPSAVLIRNEKDEDVTASYTITYVNGALEVTPKTIIVRAGSNNKIYDGKPLSENSYTAGDLVGNDKVVSAEVAGSQTVVGKSDNIASNAKIEDGSGNDVTYCYTIQYEKGLLEVTPLAVTVTAGSDTKVYDGTPLTKNSYTNTKLAEGDSISSVTVTGSQTAVGSSDNVPSNVKIINANGEDVTFCYEVTPANGTLKVTALGVVITADSAEKVYDGTALTKNSFTHTVLADGDRISKVTITGSQTVVGDSANVPSQASIVNRNGYDVTASYAIGYANGTLKVTPKEITITADSDEKTYDGTALTKNSYTNTALASGDTIDSVVVIGSRIIAGDEANVPSDAKIVNGAGTDVTASYKINYVNGNLHVKPMEITITADDADKTYDGIALTKNSYTNSALASGDSIQSVTISGSIIPVGTEANVPSAAKIVNAAGADVTASYKINYVNGTLEITKRDLTITAASDEKQYDGTALTNNGYTSKGLAAGDSVDTVTVTGSQTVYGTSENVASAAHIVNAAGVDVTACYNITYEKGALEVTKKPITITADSDEKIYDGSALTKNSYTNDSLAGNDRISTVTITGSQTIVGTSDNVPSAAKIVNAANEDVTGSYEITYANGTLEVTPKAITITADSDEKVYDGSALTKNSYTNDSLAGNDRMDSVTVTGSQTVVGTSANVPSAAKIVNAAGVDVTASYTITYVNGALEVTPKVLTITADSDEKVYDGTALTKNSYTNTALAAGDSISSVTVSGSIVNVGTENNVPSAAKIVNAAGVDVTGSYTITYANGTLEVTKKSLTITADGDTKQYDGTVLTKDTYTNSELAAGDSISSVTVTGSQTVYGTSANVPSAAVITNAAGEDVSANYEITYANGTLEVTKKPVIITANSGTQEYNGTTLTDSGYTNGDLAAGDSISSVTVRGSQTYAGKSDNVPSAAKFVNAAGEDVSNSYEVTYANGTLEVTPKPIVITADSDTKVYDGTPLTKPTYTTDKELVSGDSFANVTITGSQTNVGHSDNVASDAKIVNRAGEDITSSYAITYAKGLLEVTQNLSVVITAASDSKVYDGTPLTNSGYTSTKLADGDRILSVVVRGSITKAGSHTNIASDAIIVNALDEDVTANYQVRYEPGNLVVTKKALAITAGSDSKQYDGTALTKDSYKLSTAIAETDRIDSVTVAGSQTDAGSSLNKASNAVILNAEGENVAESCYDITYVDGSLTVTKKPITITALGGSKVYDGTALTNGAYKNTAVANGDSIRSVTMTGSQTAAGSSANVPSEAVIRNSDNKDVTGNYEITYVPATLTVTKRPLQITAASDEKVYDATPLTNSGYKDNGNLAAIDRLISVEVEGSQTNAGSSANTASDALIRNIFGEDVTDNYAITYVDGTLTVTKKTITITAGGGTKVYDGTPLTNDDYNTGEDDLEGGDHIDTIVIDGSQTDAGSSKNTPSDAVIKNEDGEDVTDNYEIIYEESDLVVTPKPITITADSAEKIYDGTPLTADGYTSSAAEETGDGLENGDMIESVKVTGSQTNVGKSDNVPSDAKIVDKDGRDVTANYAITYDNGELTVTPKIVTVTVSDQTKEFGQYDEDPIVTVEGNLNNDPIEYTVSREEGEEPGEYPITPSGEEEQGNYIVVYVPGTLTITFNPTEATVSKVWVDDSNRDGIRPVSLAVTLHGSDGLSQTMRLSDANGWKVTISELPIFAENEPVEYWWTEESVDGYTAASEINGTATVFTNTHEIARTTLSVNKIWDDKNNVSGHRPSSLSVRLNSNGSTILGVSLNEANGWSATVNNLPLYENGRPVEYSWSEQSVGSYYPVSSITAGTQTTFTNSNLYKLTIHYVYATGGTAAEDYTVMNAAGETFAVDSPLIEGFVANLLSVVGEQPAHDVEFTVVYSTSGTEVVPTPTPAPTPVPTIVPTDIPEEPKEVPQPRVSEPNEEHPIVVAEPNILVDIDDLETALGLGESFINNSGYALE